MSKIRWGILSTAKIGTEKVIPAMLQCEHGEVIAISSRTQQAADTVAKRLGIPRAYGSYEALLNDADVDAIYNPLPNHLHVSWSIRALQAGKHVLCEKPIGLSSQEGLQLVEAGKQHPELKLMEAFMYRHHPQWKKAKSLVLDGQIGELKSIQTIFSYYNDNPEDIRNQAEIGGGGLMDIGCYAISLSRFLFEEEPQRVIGLVEYDPRMKTDRLASAILDFGRGSSTFTCSTQLVPFQRVNIFGTEGQVEIEVPFNAPLDRDCKLWLQRGRDEITEMTVEQCNQYTIQGDLFALAILNNTSVPTPIEDAIANMRVIEAVLTSGQQSAWVTV